MPGWYFKDGSTTNWRPRFKAFHLSYTSRLKVQCKATVKVTVSFTLSAADTLHQKFQSDFFFTKSQWSRAAKVTHSCRSELTRQGISLLNWPWFARLPGLRSRASLALTPSIDLPAPGRRHTLTRPLPCLQSAVFLINSRSGLVSSTSQSLRSKSFSP